MCLYFPSADKYVDALGSKWHIHHFVCKRCNMPFNDSNFIIHNGYAYCPEDYAALFVAKVSGSYLLIAPPHTH